MSGKVQIKAWVNEDVKEAFEKMVVELHGQKYGNLSREVENALKFYTDKDRLEHVDTKLDRVIERLDEMQSAHTHKQTETVQKAEQIATAVGTMGRTTVLTGDVERHIEDNAGGDERTIRKYKDVLKRRGLLYEHPSDENVWTPDRDVWVRWVVEHVNNSPTVKRTDVIDEYPIGYDEIEELAAEVYA